MHFYVGNTDRLQNRDAGKQKKEITKQPETCTSAIQQ